MHYNKEYTPTIPKFAADYINWTKLQTNLTLKDLLDLKYFPDVEDKCCIKDIDKLSDYVNENNDIMAISWLYGYRIQTRNYIAVEHEREWNEDIIEDLGYRIAFIGQRPEGYETFNTLQDLYKAETGKTLSMEDALNNMYSTHEEDEIYSEFLEFYPDYKDKLKNFTEVAKELTYELFEHIIQGLSDLKIFIEKNDFQIDTVGNSNWSYYIMHKKYENHSLALDLWEGYNFYTISLINTDENGLFIGYQERIHHIYAPYTEDIYTAIYDHFGIIKDDIYLLENEITEHLLGIDKVVTRTEVYYEPKNTKY